MREWLEADGLGGFASGTADGIRTRRYHALLLVAATPPTGRMVLVNGCEVWVDTGGGRIALSSQRYADGTVYPDGASRIASFTADPWPRWRCRLEDGLEVVQEVLVPHQRPAVLLTWRLTAARPGVRLIVRPLLSGRDADALHRENPTLDFRAEARDGAVRWRPYPGVPAIACFHGGTYRHDPSWYRSFFYQAEADRGLDAVEDLASPGELSFDLSRGEARCLFRADTPAPGKAVSAEAVAALAGRLRARERNRRVPPADRPGRSATAYLVRRGSGISVIAGYPWFTDWGRDTFIALRGLCLATGRLREAGAVLLVWAGAVSQGMLPNRFLERGEPEFNAVDASLWFVLVAREYLEALGRAGRRAPPGARARLREAAGAILDGYAAGTRHGIRRDDDGLLAAGEPGVQLTWMDARIGDWVVTPRIGKPVEVQALWINALLAWGDLEPRWRDMAAQALTAFRARFWNREAGCLYDVVDVDHRPGTADGLIRPNQVFAAGGLPFPLLGPDESREVLAVVERELLTPVGLRTLAPGSPGYAPRYEGDLRARDGAYHQGTVWPWLLGPFVEAWVRARGDTGDARDTARRRFLPPLQRHLGEAGLGHISEIFDAEPPHRPRGCPFQAWSLGEFLRLDRQVLAEERQQQKFVPGSGLLHDLTERFPPMDFSFSVAAPGIDLERWSVRETLRDGAILELRALRPDDRPALEAFFGSVSRESLYLRFFDGRTRISDAELVALLHGDSDERVALIALIPGEGRIVGLCQYHRIPDPAGGPPRADAAFLVADAWQRRGIGSLLLLHLAAIARDRGFEYLEADALVCNSRMLDLFQRSGLEVAREYADGEIHVSLYLSKEKGRKD